MLLKDWLDCRLRCSCIPCPSVRVFLVRASVYNIHGHTNVSYTSWKTRTTDDNPQDITLFHYLACVSPLALEDEEPPVPSTLLIDEHFPSVDACMYIHGQIFFVMEAYT